MGLMDNAKDLAGKAGEMKEKAEGALPDAVKDKIPEGLSEKIDDGIAQAEGLADKIPGGGGEEA